MNNNLMIETSTYPSLSMKKVHINTAKVISSSGTTQNADENHMIHFSLQVNLSSYESEQKVYLRFRQSNTNINEALLYLSNDKYFNGYEFAYLNCVMDGTAIYREVDITKFFIDDSELKYFSIECPTGLILYTSDAATGYKPELRIEKLEANDLLPHQSEISGSVGDDQYKINLRNGKLYYDKNLLSVKTKGSSIDLAISYRPEKKETNLVTGNIYTGLGYGFKFNYQQLVYSSGSNYIYVDGNYKFHTFKLASNLVSSSANKIYCDQSGSYAILEKLTSGYIIKKDNQTLEFDSSGRLVKVSIQRTENETYEEVIEYNTSHKITKISSGEAFININYSTGLTEITASDGQTVSIASTNNRIRSITNPNGLITTYDYYEEIIESELILPLQTYALANRKKYIYTLNTIYDRKNKVVINYNSLYKVIGLEKHFNDKLLEIKEFCYDGSQTQVLHYKYNENSVIVKSQEIDMRYNFNQSGELEKSFEVVGSSACGLKYYKYDYDEVETIDFDTCSEFKINNVQLNEESSSGVDLGENEFTIQNNGEYILSVVCKLDQRTTYNSSVSSKVYVDVFKNGEKIDEINYDLRNLNFQPKYVKFNAMVDDAIDLVFYNQTKSHRVTFSSIVLTQKPSNKQIICNSISNGEFVTTVSGANLYKNTITDFDYKDIDGVVKTVHMIKMSQQDILETQKSASLGSTFNVWYNHGKNVLYNVSDVMVPAAIYLEHGEQTNIKNIINATVQKMLLIDSNNNYVTGISVAKTSYNYQNGQCELYTLTKYDGYVFSTEDKTITYDKFNKLLTEVTNGNLIKQYTYDDRGNVTKVKITSNGKSVEETYVYNEYDELVGVTNETGTETYTYNIKGNLVNIKDSNNDLIKEITYKPDLETITNVGATINNLSLDIAYEYDEILRETKHQSDLSSFEYIYDDYGRISSILRNSTPILTYSYTIASSNTTIEVTNEKNEVTKYIYNKYGNLIEKTEGTTNVKYYYSDYQGQGCYNAKLRSKTITTDRGSSNYEYRYDLYGRFRYCRNNTNSNTYTESNGLYVDSANHQIAKLKVISRGGTLRNVTEKQIEYILEDNKQKQYNVFTYFGETLKFIDQVNLDDLARKNNRITQVGNSSFNRNYEYASIENNTTGLISKETVMFRPQNAVTGPQLSETSYNYTNGKITQVIKGSNTTTYTYDKLGRLVQEVNPSLNINRTYTYDVEGNMLRSDKTFEYSGQVLTKYDNKSLVYTNGYLTNYGTDVLEFAYGRLIKYNNNTYRYDNDGRRVEKALPSQTHKYMYDVYGRLFKETIQATSSTKEIEYIYGVTGMIGFVYNNQSYYYSRNILGDVESIYDSNGTLVASYEYDAWGKICNQTALTEIGRLNPIRYRGYYYDEETGLFWCNSRYYNPEWGRWISPDSIEYLDPQSINGLNLYSYCGNDPVNRYDPSGHAWDWAQFGRGLIAVGIAAAVVAAVAVITVASGGSAAPVLIGAAIGAGISGGVSAGCQLVSTGELNFGQLLTDIAIGGVSGAFGGSALGKLGMTIAGSATGFLGSLASNFVETGSMNFSSDQLWKAVGSGLLGGVVSFIGGVGAQNGKLGGVLKYSNRLSTIKQKGITGDYLNNTVKHLLREKRILINAANQAIYKSIPYTIGTSILDYYL